jgi:uncharacterized protein (UPF0335 family)
VPTLPLGTPEKKVEVVTLKEYVELLRRLKNGETTVEEEMRRVQGAVKNRGRDRESVGCCCSGKVVETSGLVEESSAGLFD